MTNLDPASDSFNVEFAEARNARGLTQKELATALGISLTMVQRYEKSRGKKYSNRPRPKVAQRIQSFFATEQPGKVLEEPAVTQGEQRPLQSYPLDALVEEMRHRGYRVNLTTSD